MPSSQLYGALTRKLHDIWLRNISALVGGGGNSGTGDVCNGNQTSQLPDCNVDRHRQIVNEIQQLFHSIDIYPTESQVYEMIQCASRCSFANTCNHSVNDNGAHSQKSKECLTFGEFCFFASVLINSYRQNLPPPKPLSHSDSFYRKLERAQVYNESSKEDVSQHDTKFDIFLGGSCNPTRWRREIVIPELKRQHITYYNPQVEQWGPELIELESYAKQNSEILFFVVDNQTRAIASMIEVAFIASTARKLILVINDLPGPKCKIVNDELSSEEYENLLKGRAFLRDVVERQGIPIFTQIPLALKSAVRVLRDNIWPQDLTPPEDDIIPVKMGHVSLGDKIIHMHKVFESLKNSADKFTFAELALAYRSLSGRDLSPEMVNELARCHLAESTNSDDSPSLSRSSSSDDPEEEHFEVVSSDNSKKCKSVKRKKNRKLSKKNFTSDSCDVKFSSEQPLPPLEEIVIDFDQFCCIISELNDKSRQAQEALQLSSKVNSGDSPSDQMMARMIMQFPNKVLEKVGNLFHVFGSMFSISSQEEGCQQSQEQSPNWAAPPTGKVSSAAHSLHRHHSTYLSNSYPSRSRSAGAWAVHLTSGKQYQSQSSHKYNPQYSYHSQCKSSHGSLIRQPSPFVKSSNNRSSSAGSVGLHRADSFRSGVPTPPLPPPTRSASPSLYGHRHSYSSPISQPNHYGLPPTLAYANRTHHHHSSTSSITSLLYDTTTDLYIGGCLENNFLNQNIAPVLKKYSITYKTLKADRWTSQRMIPLEAKNIEKSRVLLFLITKNSLDISFMIIAAHYVGLGYNVVLCIEYLDSDSPFVNSDGCTETWLSTDAIKDYNRGRSYLSDLATKVGVPVFADIGEAIQCCIEKIIATE